MSKRYKLAFQAAGVIVPVIMAAVGFLYGDIKPVVRDVCGVLLPDELAPPPIPQDAGAPR